jgi:hypothetical protein
MYSKGISWISDVRIPFVDEDDTTKSDLKTTMISLGKSINEYYNSIDYIEIDKFSKW